MPILNRQWLHTLRLLACLAIALGGSGFPHHAAMAQTPTASGSEKVTMNMRDADIRSLIQWVADTTHKNIVVHRDVQGKVTVLSAQPVTVEEAYKVFLSVLQVHGFAAIESEEALKIVPVALATAGALPPAGSSPSADMVVTVLKVNNVSALKMAELLRPLVSKEAVITPSIETNSLVIADHAANISAARALVAKLDRAGDNQIELVTLQYADATDLARSLTPLIPHNEVGSFDLILSVDERSNSILMSGDAAKRNQVRALIKKLDTPASGDGNTQVVYLHYVDATELAPILKSLAESIQSNEKDTALKTSISIEASESSNSLVINAPPAMLASLKKVISQLDIRRAQVLVEALVVEVSGDIATDIGVSWISEPDRDIIGAVNTLGDLPLAQVDTTGTSPFAFTAGKGLTFGYFNSGDLQAAIRALDATQKANILSTPTIVAIDNEEASLLVGQNVPFRTGEYITNGTTNADPFTTIERQDVGITLNVTPRINQGDSITLEIQQKTESIAPSVENASDLVTNKREIVTKALIKDGQTLVLGGLISDEETEIREKVPFLGDLPILGRLFSSTGTSHKKTNLMVFIHPEIIKDEEHVRSITQKRYDFMRRAQEQSKNRDWEVSKNQSATLEPFETFSPASTPAPTASPEN